MSEMSEPAELKIGDQLISLPVVTGSEGEQAVDIMALRKQTGVITIDPGYGNTGACESAITFLNGEQGILRHRGYSIEDLAAHASFTGVAYLLLYGDLPNEEQYQVFDTLIRANYHVDDAIVQVIQAFPKDAHPMAYLSAGLSAMSALYPDYGEEKEGEHDMAVIRILAKISGIAACSYRKALGQPMIPADPGLHYAENLLYMMFGDQDASDEFRLVRAETLDNLLIIHADHEQNCSTSTVRMVNSSNANMYTSISAGIGALWGPLHGGANQAVMEMLDQIQEEGGDTQAVLARAKDKKDPFRLMGFGHRVYKTFDPRARIAKAGADAFLAQIGKNEPLIDIAMELEKSALEDEYFKKRNLYANVDFYTGIIYRAMGIPTAMFTALFAIGRSAGWLAHMVELKNDPARRIGRPRQIYIGENARDYVPRDKR
jgi:citrate synthase